MKNLYEEIVKKLFFDLPDSEEIIGEADGPVAIVVAGSPWGLVLELLAITVIVAVLITAVILLIRYFRKRKKK